MGHVEKLRDLGACCDGREYAATKPDMVAVWRDCERADWMMWLAGKMTGPPGSSSRKQLVGCAAECAATALSFVKDEELREKLAGTIQVLQKYAASAGNECDEELGEARKAVAIDATADAPADAAVYAVAYAIAAARAADAPADAAVYAAAYRETLSSALRSMANIVRRHYPESPL